MNTSPKSRQRGLTTVEFSICGAVYFIVLFGVIEVGRLLFTLNVLDEVTRRGARLASVCPTTSNASVINNAILDGVIVNGLGPEHVSINYFKKDMTLIAQPISSDDFPDISYLRVEIQDFTHQLLIPFFFTDINMPTFTTTVVAESLGVIPPFDSNDTAGTSSC